MASRSIPGGLVLAFFVGGGVGPVHAQVLLAGDDSYAVPYGEALVVEAFGVLDNDTLDGEPAGENGATVELVADAAHGTLALAPDGSFTYTPGAGFDGVDGFVYRAVFGAVVDEATVALSACSAGPQIFTCWKEGAFLALAASLGHPGFQEGFEDDAAWGQARSPDTALEVESRGVVWKANDFDPPHVAPPFPPSPPPNEVTTGGGPARTGQWAIFDPEHGYATGTPSECDVNDPPDHCLHHDGITIRRATASNPLYGAGGFFTGTFGANVAFVLDGDWQNPLAGGKLSGGGHRFFGVIDAGPVGFSEVQFREIDGKVGQALFVFGDDFTVLAEPAAAVPALDRTGMALLVGLLALAGYGRLALSACCGGRG
jgi:hypothetical protein